MARNTIQRELVLAAVRGMPTHPTADEIYQQVAQQHPNISRATVYRNLGVLAQQGEISRVSTLNAADRFDFQTHPHYHFRCTGCDRVFDVDIPYSNLVEQIQDTQGFEFHACEVSFMGLCPECSKNQGTAG